ncbi:MAG: hypothetical protein V4697_02610 [Patescibacteria group bacterium]
MQNKNTFAPVILIIILVVIAIWGISVYKEKNPTVRVNIPNTNEPVACTMDARICPDGSAVGRQGPNCEFAACPAPTSTSTSSGTTTVAASINQKAQVGTFFVTPLSVLEDSRCPIDVQCIQAGTVRLRAQVVTSAGGTRTTDFTLGTAVSFDTGAVMVTLTDVSPAPVAGQEIGSGTYKFTFRVVTK